MGKFSLILLIFFGQSDKSTTVTGFRVNQNCLFLTPPKKKLCCTCRWTKNSVAQGGYFYCTGLRVTSSCVMSSVLKILVWVHKYWFVVGFELKALVDGVDLGFVEWFAKLTYRCFFRK